MNFNELIQQLRAERSGLEAAIQALEGISGGSATKKRRGRPPGSANKSTPTTDKPAKRRGMSPAARKRIAAAMKARWAAAKKSGKGRL